MKQIKNLSNKIGLLLSSAILLVYYFTVIINILIGQYGQFAFRNIILVAIAVFLISELVQISFNLKEKDFIRVVLNLLILGFTSYLIFKFFKDHPLYYRHNNLTNYLFQIILIIKLGFEIFNKNKIIPLIIYSGFMLFLMIIQSLNLNNSLTLMFYKNSIWFMLAYLLFLIYLFILNNFEIKHNKLAIIAIHILYAIIVLFITYSGFYTITYVKLLFEMIVLSTYLLLVFDLLLKVDRKVLIKSIVTILFLVSFIVLIYLPNKLFVFHLFVIFYSLLLFSSIIIYNFKNKLLCYLLIGIELILLVLLFVVLKNLNNLPFAIIMTIKYSLVMVSYILLNVEPNSKDLVEELT